MSSLSLPRQTSCPHRPVVIRHEPLVLGHRDIASLGGGVVVDVGVGGRAVRDLGGQATRVVVSGRATVSRVDKSSLRDAWSISRPTTVPASSKSTLTPGAISRVSRPGVDLSSM